ncbi:MAG: hypothetical protein A2161_12065 [Candidatus Schekmanbacteria bacterium RBG_13_48_7]|uniref:M23ase beta-sheet core domain-containing protein n=1 Tax=Candidatus Schekmanbacteria bacterium RBG_13_48_7 TaxID=1817878 RepID=A0A1F7RW05_9BACT|nr:MAG: hypothetical protein A2161_12065 [Candidatus Schekmanbacteria bacterium RBG_13_48_7]
MFSWLIQEISYFFIDHSCEFFYYSKKPKKLKNKFLKILLLFIYSCVFITGCYKPKPAPPEEVFIPTATPTPIPKYRSKPFILPTEGYLMSPFGLRADPLTGKKTFHDGIDISHWFPNIEVWAAAAGTVEFSGIKSGYGITIRIRHDNHFETVYCHLKIAFTNIGDTVQEGETIGIMGKTGRTTGVHLHFEVHLDGTPVNPLEYLENPVFLVW